ncbi:MAG TPA: STAS domain-containing protein [Roseiarcus sp.]|nr:STAS domain-containing protein [Roseiarcus sp.]
MADVASPAAQSAITVALPAILDLAAAAPLTERLLAARGADLTVDASEVLRIGGQCLQVLLSAAKTWSADRAAFEISRPSAEFAEALTRFGIDPGVLAMREPSL